MVSELPSGSSLGPKIGSGVKLFVPVVNAKYNKEGNNNMLNNIAAFPKVFFVMYYLFQQMIDVVKVNAFNEQKDYKINSQDQVRY